MSKKKKEDINDILMGAIEEVARMYNIPVDQAIEMMNETFEDGKSLDDVVNEQYYFYERPDYAAMGAKKFTWLAPLWNLTMRSDVQGVCDKVYEASKTVDADLRRKDLREYLYSLFNDYYPGVPPVKWRLFGALWLMERYGYNNLDAYLKEYDAEFYPDESEDDLVDHSLDFDDYIFDDHGLFDHEVNPHRMTITIELAGTSQPVKRTLKVPSNIYLCALSDLIMIAFGRKDFPGAYEFIDSEGYRYVSNEDDYGGHGRVL